jgi:hypothetical protein
VSSLCVAGYYHSILLPDVPEPKILRDKARSNSYLISFERMAVDPNMDPQTLCLRLAVSPSLSINPSCTPQTPPIPKHMHIAVEVGLLPSSTARFDEIRQWIGMLPLSYVSQVVGSPPILLRLLQRLKPQFVEPLFPSFDENVRSVVYRVAW